MDLLYVAVLQKGHSTELQGYDPMSQAHHEILTYLEEQQNWHETALADNTWVHEKENEAGY